MEIDIGETVGSTSQILCCQCGTPITPNPANTCIPCLQTQVNVSDGLPKQSTINFCKACERYLMPPNSWVSCALESRELLRICLTRLKGLNKVHLVDAGFIWTEPHSKRIKVKLTIQKEVLGSTILQQELVVEYVVHHQMCDDCHRREANDFWRAVVQIRQKTSHKRTFMYLEQLILKSKVHTSALRIKERADGLDFYYSGKQDARKMVDMLSAKVPCRVKTSQELVSHDIHNNKFQYKHTFSVEVVPISKNDLVCLPRKLALSLGNISQIVLCSRVSSSLQLLDTASLQVAELSGTGYWKHPFNSLCDHRNLTEFFILRIEPIGPGKSKHKGLVCDAWVVPLSELGCDGKQLHCRTHLGHILKDGDTAWGFNFTSANLNDSNLDLIKPADIPDVILVKKSYCDRQKRAKLRNWRLQELDKEMDITVDTTSRERDYSEFLENLEEDEAYRENVNIYFDPSLDKEADKDVPPDLPQINLAAMIQDMSIQDTN